MDLGQTIYPAASLLSAAGIACLLYKWNVLRPGSFSSVGQRQVGAVVAPIWLLCAGLVLIAQMVGAQLAWPLIAPTAADGKPHEPTLREQGLIGMAGYALGAAIALIVLLVLRGVLARDTKRTGDVGERTGLRLRFEDLGIGLVAMLLAAPACIATAYAGQWVYGLITGSTPDPVGHDTLRKIIDHRDSVWAWVVAACAVLGAPVVEEVVYRGLVQSCILSALGALDDRHASARTWWAILLTAALFALVHRAGDAVPWQAIPTLFVLGAAMGIAFERTRSLGVPIAMHVLFNAGNVAIAVLTQGRG